MSEQAYTIKPLVWQEQTGGTGGVVDAFVGGRRVAVCYEVNLDTRAGDKVWFWLADACGSTSTNSMTGSRLTLGQAKSAAESAYRKLLAEHLLPA